MRSMVRILLPSVGSSGASASSIGRFLQLDPFSGSSATVRPPNTRSGLIPTAISSTRRGRDANHVYAWPLWVPAFPDSSALARWSTMAPMLSCSRKVGVREADIWPQISTFNSAERVAQPERDHDGWRLHDVEGEQLGVFDCVITSAPAPQSAELLTGAPDLQQAVRSVSMNGCWAALLVFDRSLELPFDGAFVHDSALSWMARNNSKPQRGSQESWVVHASAEWTSTYLEDEPGEVASQAARCLLASHGGHAPRSHLRGLSPLALGVASGAFAAPLPL